MLIKNLKTNSENCARIVNCYTTEVHGQQCDFRFRCTPDPGSVRFRRRSVIHSELQMLLLELKLKTSNNVTNCLGVEMNNDQIVGSKMIR